VVLGFVTHGNEWGTLPAALQLQKDLALGSLKPAGPVTLLLGNRQAALQNVRFVEEDFNRVFTFDQPAKSLERSRAEQVRPLLDATDYFLDFHQTQTPTEAPFWTFPWTGDLGLWARAIGGAPLGLTRRANGAFSPGKSCLDEYVRERGNMGITLEVGTKGPDPEQAVRTYEAAKRFVAAVSAIARAETDLRSLAFEQPPIHWYATREVIQAVTKEHRLRPGLGNWTAVESGEVLSAPGAPEIRASEPGRILFPKYPGPNEPPPPELFRLGVPIEDPDFTFGS
jgi:succinylglutamate desuccinylase